MSTESIDLRRKLVHTHSTTNLNLIGLRKEGECPACDYARAGWVQAEREGR